MKKPAATPIFGDAFLADTTHLTAEEVGAYFLLMLAAWRQDDCSLPDEDRVLARIARISLRKWRASSSATIMQFWSKNEDGRWFQKRLRKEWDYVREKSEQAAEAANLRWGNDELSRDNPDKIGTSKARKTHSGYSAQDTENIESDECDRTCADECETHAPPPPPHSNKEEDDERDINTPLFGCNLEESDPLLSIVETWNEMAKANSLPTVRTNLNEKRRKTLRLRIKDYGAEQIIEAIRLIPERPFCLGHNPKRWKANLFPWLARPDTVSRILEGSHYVNSGFKRSGWRRN